MTDTPETSIPGERGQTSAARKVDSNPLLKRGAVVLAVVAFMGFAMWAMRQGPKEDVEQPGSGVIRQTTAFEPARAEPEPVALPVPEIKLPTPAVETAETPPVDELLDRARFAKAAGAGWFIEDHLAPIGWFEDDAAAVAERFLGAPYLWGGRESLGLDCSGLTQQALAACGIAYPRDTDQQQQLGEPLTADQLRRGDLVFWKGHVAMMLDAERIIHANAHHMATAIEPLSQTRARYVAAGVGEPTAYRRP